MPDKACALFDDHLKLYELDHLSKDPTVFEHFNDRLGAYARGDLETHR